MSKREPIKKFKHFSVYRSEPINDYEKEYHEKQRLRYEVALKEARESIKIMKPKSKTHAALGAQIHSLKVSLRNLWSGGKRASLMFTLVHHKTKASVDVANLSKVSIKKLHQEIRATRHDNRNCVDPDQERFFEIASLDMTIALRGLVHRQGNEIYGLYIKKKIHELDNPKKPKDKSNHVGIEFEFTSEVPRTDLGLMLFKAGLVGVCELKTDGSLRPTRKENGYEIAILLKEKNFQKQLKALCMIFEKINAQVENRRCGLHVHIDVRSRKKEVVYHNLVSCQGLLMKMIPRDRRNGEFCARVASKKFPMNFTGDRHERYKSINAAAFYRHGTLEVRMHEGCTTFADVRNWVSLLLKIASLKSKLNKSVGSIGAFQKVIKLNEPMSIHVRDRINKWNILTPAPARPRANFDRAPTLDEVLNTNPLLRQIREDREGAMPVAAGHIVNVAVPQQVAND